MTDKKKYMLIAAGLAAVCLIGYMAMPDKKDTDQPKKEIQTENLSNEKDISNEEKEQLKEDGNDSVPETGKSTKTENSKKNSSSTTGEKESGKNSSAEQPEKGSVSNSGADSEKEASDDPSEEDPDEEEMNDADNEVVIPEFLEPSEEEKPSQPEKPSEEEKSSQPDKTDDGWTGYY